MCDAVYSLAKTIIALRLIFAVTNAVRSVYKNSPAIIHGILSDQTTGRHYKTLKSE